MLSYLEYVARIYRDVIKNGLFESRGWISREGHLPERILSTSFRTKRQIHCLSFRTHPMRDHIRRKDIACARSGHWRNRSSGMSTLCSLDWERVMALHHQNGTAVLVVVVKSQLNALDSPNLSAHISNVHSQLNSHYTNSTFPACCLFKRDLHWDQQSIYTHLNKPAKRLPVKHVHCLSMTCLFRVCLIGKAG